MLQVLGGLILTQPQLCKMSSETVLRVFQAANVWAVPVVLGAEVWGATAGLSWPRVREHAFSNLTSDSLADTVVPMSQLLKQAG